jgi:hypothetical protein
MIDKPQTLEGFYNFKLDKAPLISINTVAISMFFVLKTIITHQTKKRLIAAGNFIKSACSGTTICSNIHNNSKLIGLLSNEA